MHNCVAPILADTSMRVSATGRQGSGGMSVRLTTIIELALALDTPEDFESVPRMLRGAQAVRCWSGVRTWPRWVRHRVRDTMQRMRYRNSNRSIADGPSMTPALQKVALVTGAARGIGLAVAKRFLAEGWRVALLDIERELLRGAVAALANPGATMALHCDISDSGAVTAAMAKLSTRFGRLDALVNNAGIAVFAPLLETSDGDSNPRLEVNLTRPFLSTKPPVPLMGEHGVAIVHSTSISKVRTLKRRTRHS